MASKSRAGSAAKKKKTEAAPETVVEKNPAPAVAEAEAPTEPKLEISASRQFTAWLAEQQLSIAFTTYQTGKIFMIGLQPEGRMSIYERTFNRCMGMCHHEGTVYMSSLYQLWQFENALQPGQLNDGYDRVYVPQVAYTTGDIDIHDMAVDKQGRLIFVNTLFSCLSRVSHSHSFVPIWSPPFISKLAAEDRCHLNGLAMEDGEPKYVTAISTADASEGWRDHRVDGGVVIDVTTNEIIASGLSMPHSPRIYRDKLWLLNSGTGYFGYIDKEKGEFVEVTFCPGYARGLTFHNDFAIVGLSTIRENKTFSGLPLDDNLKAKKVKPRCGVLVIDIRTGDTVHNIKIDGIVEELYDVVALPGVIRPSLIGVVSDEIRRVISLGEEEPLQLPSRK